MLRHGKPELDVPRCIGITDVPLCDEGRDQAKKMADWLQKQEIRYIYSSPLTRCRETAQIVAEAVNAQKPDTWKIKVQVREQLHEVRAGIWENLKFSQIKEQYPEMYEERGKNIGYYVLPEGESFYMAGLRFGQCLREILKEIPDGATAGNPDGAPDGDSDGNVLVVAHAGVISSFLCLLQKQSVNQIFELPQPYVGTSILEYETASKPQDAGESQIATNQQDAEESKIATKPQDAEESQTASKQQDAGELQVLQIGYRPPEYLDEEEIARLYAKYDPPENIIRHMQAVADYLDMLQARFAGITAETACDSTPWYDQPANWESLRKAALLHDIVRTQKNHAEEGYRILRKEGYIEIAELVRWHNQEIGGILNNECVTMQEMIFYADKRVREDQIVTVDERFQASAGKCRVPEAKEKHRRLYEKSIDIEKRIERITGGKLL